MVLTYSTNRVSYHVGAERAVYISESGLLVSLTIGSWLNKTPSDGTCLGEPPGDFCEAGCCCCFSPHWRFFINCFSTSFLTLSWAISGFLHPFYTFSPAHRRVICNTFILTFLGFSITFLPRVLWFWADVSYPRAFFTLHSFTFLWRFVTQMPAGTPHPWSSSVTVLLELSLPADAWSWTTDVWIIRPLVYQLP